MNEQELFSAAKRISLTPGERVAGKEWLIAAMADRSAPGRAAHGFLRFLKPAFVLVIALLLIGGSGIGISFAADHSLPGDLLYPVKIHVNERLRARLIKSPVDRARFAVDTTSKRLQEAETLAQRAKLGPKESAAVIAQFRSQMNDAERQLSSLPIGTARGVRMELKAALRAHDSVITAMTGSGEEAQSKQLAELTADIHSARIHAEEEAIAASGTDDNEESDSGGTVINSLKTRAQEQLGSLRIRSSSYETSATVTRQADLAAQDLSGALEAASPSEKSRLVQSALRHIRVGSSLETIGSRALSVPDEDAPAQVTKDTSVATEARLRVTKKALDQIDRVMTKKRLSAPVPATIEEPANAGHAYLDAARLQLDAGQPEAALDSAKQALKQARQAKRQLEQETEDQ